MGYTGAKAKKKKDDDDILKLFFLFITHVMDAGK